MDAKHVVFWILLILGSAIWLVESIIRNKEENNADNAWLLFLSTFSYTRLVPNKLKQLIIENYKLSKIRNWLMTIRYILWIIATIILLM